ncbi:helix-turn-helix domain-containing protein [Nocardiopsis lambiniae]|uniref:Helix-turn-helix domain-containing protein n=1 Tax=Nocardiopsis lambiniae TaxID=3075539 RepID=A0ABU2MCK1_9ACTN|nr:helix-turn-helix domain-containing protein [Nocardiopsis sp. DSM 44743]MDT0330420.1 helix-turn-helix domain-containing protein [Nocardiopsis sp. DSM 44743]
MSTAPTRVVEEISPPTSPEQKRAARRIVDLILGGTTEVMLRLPEGEEHQLDSEELRALLAIALARAEGHRVSVISHDVMLSPQQAAELLGVSRPMVYRFIERGELEATRVGTHWRLSTTDVIALVERRSLLMDRVDTGFDQVTEAMLSQQKNTPTKGDAEEGWRTAAPEQRRPPLERVRKRTRGRRT